MLFYVYMQPEVIALARESGPFALQSLVSFLRGALQNCCLAVFEDDRMRHQIGEFVETLPEDFDRKSLKTVLTLLEKRNRFIYILKPDYSGVKSDLLCALEAADRLNLDLLLLENDQDAGHAPARSQTSTLASYQHTNFEIERARLATEGRTSLGGAMTETDFLNIHFDKALRYVGRIEICDRIFGRNFGDNFEYTARVLLHWLENVITDPAHCIMICHVGAPPGLMLNHIQTQLTSFRRGRLAGLPIELHVYDVPQPDQCLPHERFIVTDQLALEIGRGMDFLDRATHRNRDVSIGYKSMKEVQDLLNSYAIYKRPVVRF